MCGIFGYYNFEIKKFRDNSKVLHILMNESFSRGKEASGLAVLSTNSIVSFIKSDLDGKSLLKSEDYSKMIADISEKQTLCAIGHSRLATHGTQLVHANNQPVFSNNQEIVGIHNGIITNPKELWQLSRAEGTAPELDTKSLVEYFTSLTHQMSPNEALEKVYKTIEGSASIAFLDTISQQLYLATNTGSLYYVTDPSECTIYFASEKIFLQKIIPLIQVHTKEITQLKPQSALVISTNNKVLINFHQLKQSSLNTFTQTPTSSSLSTKDYSSSNSKSKAVKLYTIKNSLEKLRQHDFDYQKIYDIKRCTKCILPATTPFIVFDNKGVCNFCNEHKKISHHGLDELKKVISKYKKSNGEPDCLAAFSGGRDSAYGLHFLKKELGLQPLAYTYDWGMVTDIARENQARILGKLGIEHIVVSADITMKRKHIKENILAWMKDPHLGMVPLFMEGDKQCEYYADQIMKKYNLPLMFFFRGNELEKDEFKTGHCGVKDADPGGVIHNLEPLKKIKLLSFYASRYFKNPAYFNSSFFDTSLGFFSTYIQPHNYLFLWHYIPWDEQTIVSTLKNEYNWQASDETISTWRTDDGTSAFYNYIYYQVQGFTENDSFRSRQIREGIIDRDTALKLVNEENKPRHKALEWYFDMVGLDGNKVLEVVDKMKKLY